MAILNKFTVLLLTATLSGCGIADTIAKDCGGHFKQLCQAVFGITPEEVDELSEEVDQIKLQIEALENQNSTLLFEVSVLENIISIVDTENTTSITQLSTQLTTIENEIAQNVTQIAILNGFQHIDSLVDPCGNAPTVFDEVFIKVYRPSTNSFTLVASFSENSNGKNTRFSVLPVGGPYVTTDGDNCQFSVAQDGHTIINQSKNY